MSTDALFEESNGPRRDVLTVRQINEGISEAVERAFPGTVWVRGEVQRLPHDAARRTHVYFELHETGGSGAAEYQISTSLMGWDRQRFNLGRYLDGTDPDFQLANQMEVCLECKVDFYAKFGKMSLKVVGVDKNFALGRLEARRREILAYLKQEDLLEKNAGLHLPELPLRVGLITSPGSAAERDFMTGIEDSPWAFRVRLRGARMQGEQLQAEVIRGLEGHAAGGVDVIVLTRGGGSRADLSWFDQRDLAVAIAECPVPVITAIGHEIDTSIADLVAHHACKTPTAAAEFLVAIVDDASNRLEEATERLGRAAEGVCLRARVHYQSAAGRMQDRVSRSLAAGRGILADLRTKLGTTAVTRVSTARETLGALRVGLEGAAQALTARAHREQAALAVRLGREAVRPMITQGVRLEGLATQARLMDPALLLARGFTITLDEQGRAVTRAASLAPGDIIGTRFSDALVHSIVQPGHEFAVSETSSKQGKGKRSGGKKDKPEKDTGQKTLFR